MTAATEKNKTYKISTCTFQLHPQTSLNVDVVRTGSTARPQVPMCFLQTGRTTFNRGYATRGWEVRPSFMGAFIATPTVKHHACTYEAGGEIQSERGSRKQSCSAAETRLQWQVKGSQI